MKEINNKVLNILFGLPGLIIISCLVFSCILLYMADPSSYLSEEIISSEQGASFFNAQEVLSKIRNGDKNVFSEKEPDTDYSFLENRYHIVFTDEELYEIAQYYFQTIWDDDPADWILVNVYYRLNDCDKGFDGPYSVSYVYEKKIKIGKNKYVNVREVGIAAWKNHIGWTDKVENPYHLSYSIDWEAINYHAMDAYEIAEENGGADIHAVSENPCVDIYIALYGNNRNWNIDYNDRLGSNLFDLKIDSKTGEIKD
jgi:hypothetical protein